ncbi:SRPBCC family protein [Amycolatopsis benzoatilytica]|uniref:SRPBCC family protein n=1 Tax=Amycolatopsis benzoatilytica TaxID=346045 RepID=UPI0003605C41|nr:SRPBCC family protein [Amycolatopsis benzoatilytica]
MEWTGARYADAPTVQVDAWIDGPPEQVWELASDVRLMPELSGELQTVEWTGEAPAIGQTFIGRNHHQARGEWETISHIIECEQPRVFAWAVTDPANPTAVWRFTLTPENGGTRLTQWVQMGPGPSGVSQVIARMPEKEQKIVYVRLQEFEAAMTATVGAIKERVETAG